ncbi:MAG: chorismate mutase [Verrucomicrobiota bacterium]
MTSDPLQRYRRQIDQIDRQLLDLLNERIRVSIQIGTVKLARGWQVFAPEREEEVLRSLEAMNDGPLERETLRSVYREIINGSIAVQARLAIGYLGRKHSQIAMVAVGRFGSSHDYRGFDSLERFWQALQEGRIEIGVVERARLVTYALEQGGLPLPVCTELDSREEESAGSGKHYFVISRTQRYSCKLSRTVVWIDSHSAEMCVKTVKSLLEMEKLPLLRSELIRLPRPAQQPCVQVELAGDVPEESLRTLMEKLPRDLIHAWCRVGCFP